MSCLRYRFALHFSIGLPQIANLIQVRSIMDFRVTGGNVLGSQLKLYRTPFLPRYLSNFMIVPIISGYRIELECVGTYLTGCRFGLWGLCALLF